MEKVSDCDYTLLYCCEGNKKMMNILPCYCVAECGAIAHGIDY